LGVKLQELPVTDVRHFEGALRSATAGGVGALLVVEESLFMNNRKILVDLIAKHRLPAMYPQPEHVELGGLLSAARGLGLTIPPSLLVRADRVVE